MGEPKPPTSPTPDRSVTPTVTTPVTQQKDRGDRADEFLPRVRAINPSQTEPTKDPAANFQPNVKKIGRADVERAEQAIPTVYDQIFSSDSSDWVKAVQTLSHGNPEEVAKWTKWIIDGKESGVLGPIALKKPGLAEEFAGGAKFRPTWEWTVEQRDDFLTRIKDTFQDKQG